MKMKRLHWVLLSFAAIAAAAPAANAIAGEMSKKTMPVARTTIDDRNSLTP